METAKRNKNGPLTQEPATAAKAQVLGMLDRLPPSAVRALLDQALASDRGGAGKAMAIAAMIDFLNRRRPNRAQRLVMAILDGFLTSDPVLLQSERYVLGVLHRFDLNGLWAVLNRGPLGDRIRETQDRLDVLAADTLIDRVLTSDEALALQDRLATAILAHLRALLRTRAELNKFLHSLNSIRLAEAKRLGLKIERLAELDGTFIEVVTTLLAHRQDNGDVTRLLAMLAKGRDTDRDLQLWARLLAREAERFRGAGAGAGPLAYHVLVTTTAVNVLRMYALVPFLAGAEGMEELDRRCLIDVLLGHLSGCGSALRATFASALPTGLGDGVPVRLEPADREAADHLMARVDRLLNALTAVNALADRNADRWFRHHWQDCARHLSAQVVPVLNRRLMALLAARSGPAADHEDVVWLFQRLWTWHQLAKRQAEDGAGPEEWRLQIERMVHQALGDAVQVRAQERPGERMPHLMRIGSIAAVVGSSLSELFKPTDHGLIAIVTDRLRLEAPLAGEERFFIKDFLRLGQRELERTRSWPDPRLSEMLKLGTELGYLVF